MELLGAANAGLANRSVLKASTIAAIERITTPHDFTASTRFRLIWLRFEPLAKIRSDLPNAPEAARAPETRTLMR
jgi:hypothetical protein